MIDQQTIENLQKEASKTSREICGIISSSGTVYPIKNVVPSNNHFLMDKKEYCHAWNEMHDKDETFSAIYHSHPMGNPEPSEADMDFLRKSKIPMLIVTSTDWRYITNE